MTTACQSRKPPATQNGHSCVVTTLRSHKLLHRRPNTEKFAIVLTPLPSLPTRIPLAFLSVFHLVPSIQQFLHPFSPSNCLLTFISFVSRLLPVHSSHAFSSPSPFPGTFKCGYSAVKQKGKTQASGESYCKSNLK